jgi:uncharacterized protein YaaQ
MKLIIAIVRDQVQDDISQALTATGFRVTEVASTGGFLKRGMTTLLVGVDDDKMEDALILIRSKCPKSEEGVHSAVIFVLKVADFTHF